MEMNEKRKSPRIMKRLEVRFLAPEENTAITSNVSKGGLFIRTKREVEPGRELDIHITLPNTVRFSLRGSVIRARSEPGLIGDARSGMGVELIDPSQDYMHYVQSILD